MIFSEEKIFVIDLIIKTTIKSWSYKECSTPSLKGT